MPRYAYNLTAIVPPKKARYSSEQTMSRLRARMAEFGKRVVEDAADYPPPWPTSRYVRTGRLGAGWRAQVQYIAGAIVLVVTNEVDYAMWVMGPPQLGKSQTALMKDRGWRTIDQVFAENWPEVRDDCERILASSFG